MGVDSKELLKKADDAFKRKKYPEAMELYSRGVFHLIFHAEKEIDLKRAMTQAILCYQQINPAFTPDSGLDYIQQYFIVVRHWHDYSEITESQLIEKEIYREIPFEAADDLRDELPEGDTHSQTLESNPYDAAIASGQGIREEMEDAHAAQTFTLELDRKHLFHLFCIFDGHGGKTCACYTAQHLPQVLVEEIGKLNCLSDQGVYHALVQTCIRVDQEWKELPFQEGEYKDNSGTTAVIALLIDGKELWVANVGDSGAAIDDNGKATQLTESAKPTIPRYYQEIFMRGGIVSYGRVDASLDMARSIGDLAHPSVSARPTIKKIAVSKDNNFLILACDGFWDVIEPQTAIDSIQDTSALEAAELLRKLAYQRGSSDNVTILVIQLQPRGISSQ